MAPIVTIAELSEMTGRPETWWRRNWLRMHERHAFPRKLPGLWGWPRKAVEAWIAAGGFVLPELPAANQNSEPDLGRATALLEARFGISS
jgi:predicted DNA-binding transcriptional regulator AlpA